MNGRNSIQKCERCGCVSYGMHNEVVKYCKYCKTNVGSVCWHTDEQDDCPNCGLTLDEIKRALMMEWIGCRAGYIFPRTEAPWEEREG